MTPPVAPTAPTSETTESIDTICHALDEAGRPLCGARRNGRRPKHNYAECLLEGHRTCRTCMSLSELAMKEPA